RTSSWGVAQAILIRAFGAKQRQAGCLPSIAAPSQKSDECRMLSGFGPTGPSPLPARRASTPERTGVKRLCYEPLLHVRFSPANGFAHQFARACYAKLLLRSRDIHLHRLDGETQFLGDGRSARSLS